MNDGGPAFPFPSGPEPRQNEFHDRCEGMSLRDYFAGQALVGLLANPNNCTNSFKDDAFAAFEAADAMLAEREWRKG